jgi:hypothetical protein
LKIFLIKIRYTLHVYIIEMIFIYYIHDIYENWIKVIIVCNNNGILCISNWELDNVSLYSEFYKSSIMQICDGVNASSWYVLWLCLYNWVKCVCWDMFQWRMAVNFGILLHNKSIHSYLSHFKVVDKNAKICWKNSW